MKRVLITGASSHVAEDLIKDIKSKYNVTLGYNKKVLKVKKVTAIKINLKLKKKIKLKFDYLANFASATPFRVRDERDYNEINVKSFKNFLTNFKNTKKIFLLSAISIYGNVNEKILDENYKPIKPDKYGLSKLKMENILIKHCQKHKIKYLIARSPAVIDKKLNHNNFINNLAKNIKNNKLVSIHSLNKKYNNLTSPEMISKIVKKFFNSKKLDNEIFNLCCKKPIMIKKVVRVLEKNYNKKGKILNLGEKKNFIISYAKLNKAGISPPTTLKTIKSLVIYNQKI